MVTRELLQDLVLDHAVEFTRDNTVFACSRDNSNGHTRLFLIFDRGLGRVYSRNGRADSWELVDEELAKDVRRHVWDSWENIPVYRINGSSN